MTAMAARGLRRICLAAALLLHVPAAVATAFVWDGGPFSTSGVPNPLVPPDTALMSAPTAAPVFDVGFTNASFFAYRDNNLVFGDGVRVVNDGTWVSQDDHGLIRLGNVKVVPRFINNGSFVKTGGGPTQIVNVRLVNRGQIVSLLGVIALNSPTKVFEDGSVLLGVGSLGRIEIRNGGGFQGSVTADNVELVHGTYDGVAARLAGGRTDWTAGAFTGSWTNGGHIVARSTGGVRLWGAGVTFTNDSVFRWESGEMNLSDGARVVNNGLYEAVPSFGSAFGSVTAFDWTGGAARATVVNNGRFVYAPAGRGNLLVGDVHFVNTGVVRNDSADVIVFNGPATFESGTRFEGGPINVSHDATFRGAFTATSLFMTSGTYTGVDAVMQGAVAWLGGTFAGGWRNDGRLAVNDAVAATGISGLFVNGGTVEWLPHPLGGSILVGSPGTLTTIENLGNFKVSIPTQSVGRFDLRSGALAVFVNRGNFVHEGRGTTAFDIPFQNSGELTVRGGTARFDAGLDNDTEGRVRLESAVIDLQTPALNLGRITGTGRIIGRNRLTNLGHIDPGLSPGTLTIEGDYVHGATGVLNIELADLATFDRLVVEGDAELQGGELALHCLLVCDLDVGDVFDFLDVTGELTGAFGAVTLHGFGDGWRFDVGYDYDADLVRLRVLAVGAPPPGVVGEPGALGLAALALLALARMSVARRATPGPLRS